MPNLSPVTAAAIDPNGPSVLTPIFSGLGGSAPAAPAPAPAPVAPSTSDVFGGAAQPAAPVSTITQNEKPVAPQVSIARHILDALGGSNGAPGSWAKSTVAGALASMSGLAKGLTTGPGQGPVAPGQGWLAGAAAGGNSYQQEIQKRQQQQTENQLKDRQMTNEEQTSAANRAYLSAQTAASIQKAQQDQGLYATKQAESAMQLRTAMISAGIPVDEVEEVTGYDQLTKDHAQQLGSGKLVAVPNGKDHKTGEDQAGALLLPTDALNKKIPQPMPNYVIGYKADPKTGEPVAVTVNVQAGTTVGTLLAAHAAAMNQLGQITEAQKQKAAIDKDKAETSKSVQGQELERQAAPGQRALTAAKTNESNAAAEKDRQAAQLAAKQAADPDSLTPKERFTLRKSGQAEADKSNKEFNTFIGQANSIEGSIKLSKDGNELASAIIPLQGTLFITTSEGVKRINETELSGVANAGSIARRGQNAYQKFLNGDTSAQTKQDLVDLVHAYRTAKFQQYLNNQNLVAHNYGMKPEDTQVYGSDGKPVSLAEANKRAAASEVSLPQAAASQLKEGIHTTFANGQTWTMQNGKPVQVQ